MQQYRIVSADDHVEEAKDTWQKRVAAPLRDRAPRVVRTPAGDAWVIDGKQGGTMGLGVQGGKKFEDYRASGETYETIRPGAFDPVERLKDMDIDGVDAQTLYPNTALSVFGIDDLNLQLACLRAYNDWLSEFCSTNPKRLLGIGLVPTDEPGETTKELRRFAKLPGMRGALLPTYPHGEPLNSEVYDPFWAAAQDLGLPVHIHLRTGKGFSLKPGRGSMPAYLTIGSLANYEALATIVWSGILEKFPRLNFVSVEGNIGWLPYFLEKADTVYKRHRYWTKSDLPKPPSEYFHRQVYATFIEDKAGVALRHMIGIDNLMWSSDYPHTDTTWPHSQKYITDHFQGVPEGEKRKMVVENAARLYRLTN
ncbi:MAG: amidohydrolase [Chloroflexi bacterium]|nr:amidohydrolase [Chloroflexota bacterium]